jgi:hypothetical protein
VRAGAACRAASFALLRLGLLRLRRRLPQRLQSPELGLQARAVELCKLAARNENGAAQTAGCVRWCSSTQADGRSGVVSAMCCALLKPRNGIHQHRRRRAASAALLFSLHGSRSRSRRDSARDVGGRAPAWRSHEAASSLAVPSSEAYSAFMLHTLPRQRQRQRQRCRLHVM